MSKTFLRNILRVLSSNIISLIESIVIGLLVPIMLGVTDYGYYRMFLLYSTYTALLHFGFVDGILLKDGGKRYNYLNKVQYRSNSFSFIILEAIVSIIIIVCSFLIDNHIYSFLFLAVGINTFLTNVSTYYQFLSQAIMDFKGYSIRIIIQYSLMILITFFLWIMYKLDFTSSPTYREYIIASLFVTFIILILCIYSFKDITFGNRDSLSRGFVRLWKFCKIGIYLTISYQVSHLIMVIDNQFVSMFFKAHIYGEYSFSYSMTNIAITLLGSIATVLFPHLKRDTFKHAISVYHKMISVIMLIVYLSLLAYFPMCLLINIIMPQYNQSLNYFRIFLPELGVTCSVTMITFNYYNAFGKSKFYFYMSLSILMLSVIIDAIIYIIFNSSFGLTIGSFISVFIWYICSEYFLIKWYHIKWIKNFVYMIIMIVSFFIISTISNIFIGFMIYLFIYLFISFLLFKDIIFQYLFKLIREV